MLKKVYSPVRPKMWMEENLKLPKDEMQKPLMKKRMAKKKTLTSWNLI